jgi:multicomponent Na+:H+ antiporter subunit G
MIHLLVALLLVTGTTFTLIAAIGVLRMPDVYMRLQVSTKGATLGAGTLLLAVPIFFGDVQIFVRALLIIAFIVLTTPISGHMLARAAYIVGVPLWDRSVVDELAGRYDPETGELAGPATTAPDTADEGA